MTLDVTNIKKIERTPTQALVVEVKVPSELEEEDIGKYMKDVLEELKNDHNEETILVFSGSSRISNRKIHKFFGLNFFFGK